MHHETPSKSLGSDIPHPGQRPPASTLEGMHTLWAQEAFILADIVIGARGEVYVEIC